MVLFNFLHKQKNISKKQQITKILINSLRIPEEQKKIFLNALTILDEEGLNKVYNELTYFIKELEIKELDDISKTNFTKIEGLQEKEAKNKQKELNAFSFLLNNV